MRRLLARLSTRPFMRLSTRPHVAAWMLCLAAGVLGCSAPGAASSSRADRDPQLSFVSGPAGSGGELRIGLEALRAACAERTVEVEDPYHEKRMRYRALALECVLDLGFAETGGAAGQRDRGLLLRALDGYTRPVSGRELLDPGVYLAFAELPIRDAAVTGPEAGRAAGQSAGESPRFSPIDRAGVDPGPFYMVWTGIGQNDPHEHPWPYQLSRIEVAPFTQAFPRTVPAGLAKNDPGWAGYALFQRSCASCHSINGEGGKIGPDLNVPRSIVEYRPIPQIRAYIRNPQATRYTSMPGHPDFSEADIDALIAYLSAMSLRKDDPREPEES